MPYKQIIKDAKNKNKLAIFVGSGVSKNSNLPDWGELIEELKQEIGLENETDFLKIAQLYYLAVGEVTYNQKIKSFFSMKSEPNELHELIFDLKPKYLITTNWDNLLSVIKKEISKKRCVVLGTTRSCDHKVEVDHKDGRKIEDKYSN